MISHRHRCIFIHIPKTGGMSVEKAFMNSLRLKFCNGECPPLLLTYNRNAEIGPVSLAHLSPVEYVKHSYLTQDLFNDYFKFAIVRNPYDRIVSIYKHFKYDRVISFSSFIKQEFPKLKKKRYYFIKPQVEYLYGEDQQLLVDFVGRFENLANELKNVETKLEHHFGKLEHLNRSGKSYNVYSRWNVRFVWNYIKKNPGSLLYLDLRNKTGFHPLDHFDEETLQIINEFYLEDFSKLDYEKIHSL